MVAVRVSRDLRPAVVGSLVYFESHPKPASPRDVPNHRCIRFRHRGESVHKYELDQGDESLAFAVNGSLLLDDVDLVIQAALDGAGLAWVTEDRIAEHLASGALIRVFEDWCRPFPGFFLYYPTRKKPGDIPVRYPEPYHLHLNEQEHGRRGDSQDYLCAAPFSPSPVTKKVFVVPAARLRVNEEYKRAAAAAIGLTLRADLVAEAYKVWS
jgi:LysR substrate binding domain